MSIQTQIDRIVGLKNRIGAVLREWGISPVSNDLDGYTETLEGIQNRGTGGGEISEKSGSVQIQQGYYSGTGNVQIAPAEQQKIVPGNIKQGVTVLGVTGDYSGDAANLQSKTITPTETAQNVTADPGYDALSQVTVNPIPGQYKDVSAVTAIEADVLSGKIIVTEDGNVTGTMENRGAVSGALGLTVSSYTVPAGYHNGNGRVTLSSDIEEALAAI